MRLHNPRRRKLFQTAARPASPFEKWDDARQMVERHVSIGDKTTDEHLQPSRARPRITRDEDVRRARDERTENRWRPGRRVTGDRTAWRVLAHAVIWRVWRCSSSSPRTYSASVAIVGRSDNSSTAGTDTPKCS